MIKSLLLLLKLTVLPILALIVGKLLGIYIAGFVMGIDVIWNFSSPISFLNPTVALQDIKSIINFADLFMFVCLAFGMSLVVIQGAFLHDSHLDVSMASRLANFNLLSIVKSTYEIYHSGFIWTLYLIMGLIVILMDVINMNADAWVLIFTGVFSLLSIVILVKDVFNEIEIAKSLSIKKNYEGQ